MARRTPSAADLAVFHDEDWAELVTGEAVALDLRPAPFILRAAGSAIDFLVYVIGGVLYALLLFDLASRASLDQPTIMALAISGLVLCAVIVPTAVEALSQGKSLGKLAVGVRIVRDDGGAIGVRHAFIRALTGVLEIFMTVGGFAAVTALLNGRAKRLGDLLAGTYGQYERVPRVHPPVFGVPVELGQWALTADVGRIPDGLGRRIAAFIAQAAALTPSTRLRLSEQLADEVSPFVAPLPPLAPGAGAELFLAAVIAVRRDRELRALLAEKQRLEALQPLLGGLPHRFPARS